MRSLSFRGHGQRTGYNPIKYPSFVNRIEEETNRTLRAMKEAHQGEMQIRQDYLQGLRYKEQQEASNRRENFNLATGFDRAYRATEEKQLELERQQLNVRYQTEIEKTAQLDKIKELIPKTLMAGAKAYGVRNERLENEGYRLALEYGLSPQEINTIAFLRSNINSYDLGVNKIRHNLEDKYGPEVLNQFLDVSGARLHGMMKGAATNFGKYHLTNRIDDLAANHKLASGQTLNTIQSVGGVNSSEFEAGLKELKGIIAKETLYDPNNPNKKGGFNAPFAALHIKPHIDKAFDKRRTINEQSNRTAYKEAVEAKELQDLKNAVFDTGGIETNQPLGDRVMNWVERQAGGDGTLYGHYRRKAATHLAAMAASGEMTYEEWEAIKEGKVNVGGKEVLIGEQWKKDWVVVENAFNTRFEAEAEALKNRDKRIINEEYINIETIRQQMPDKRFSFNELDLHKKVLISKGIDITKVEHLKTYENLLASRMNAATTESYLQSSYDSGKLNAQILLDPRLDGEVAKNWEKLVPILGDPTVKGELDTIGQRVKKMMGQMLPTAELEGDTNSLITRAKEILRKRILQGIKSGQYDTPAEAALAESIKLSKTIADKDDDFRVDANGKPLILKNPKLGKGSYYVRHIKNNKAFISTPGVFEEADLKAIQDTNINGIPDFIKTINTQYPKRDPYEIMNEILRANNLEKIDPMGISKSYRYVHPRFKQYLCNKPSMAKTCNAMFKTTQLMNPDYDPFLPMLDAIKDKGAVNTDEQYGGFDAYKEKDSSWLTGTEKFKKPLTEMLVGEVLNNQGLGRMIGAGPYSIDIQDLRSMYERGYVGIKEKFDENIQRRIAQLMLWERSGKFLVNTSEKGVDARTIIPGIGQEWVQIAGPGGHISEDEEVDIAQKLELVKQNLEKMGGFNLLLLRDEVQELMYHKLAGDS